MTPFVADVLIPLGKIAAVVLYPMVMVVVMIWLERRVVALMQLRLGPNRVGFQGLAQPIADAVKLFFKEDIRPRQADRLLFALSPVLVMFSSLLAFCFVPLGAPVRLGSYTLTLWVAESPVGLLLVLGLSSISVFGVIFGGWAANSKYPLMGALRSVVQVLSYEIPLGLTVLTVAFSARSMDLVEIVRRQEAGGVWYGFLMPVSLVVFWISAVAETNRAPFDLPEAESELVAGYHTEYSSMKFALLQMAEYINMITVAALTANLFLGGADPGLPFLPSGGLWGLAWFGVKTLLVIFTFFWLRATVPRFRYDQLMHFGWKVLVPLATLNVLATAGWLVFSK